MRLRVVGVLFARLRERRHRVPGARSYGTLIQLERILVVEFAAGVLRLLAKETVSDSQRFDLRTHETPKSILGSADNWFPANVKACVHDHRAAGLLLESRDQCVVARIGFVVYRLNAR